MEKINHYNFVVLIISKIFSYNVYKIEDKSIYIKFNNNIIWKLKYKSACGIYIIIIL